MTLVLQDGRTLTCTPDHEILRDDGCWVRADQLELGKDRVVMGLEAPADEPASDEAGYVLLAGSRAFSMTDEHERSCTLAFARLLGHLLADGSIRIEQTIYVERESQRKIVLGAKGQTIKEIGKSARADIGEMAGVPEN